MSFQAAVRGIESAPGAGVASATRRKCQCIDPPVMNKREKAMVRRTLRKAGLGRKWAYRKRPLEFLCQEFERLISLSKQPAETSLAATNSTIQVAGEVIGLPPDAITGVALVGTKILEVGPCTISLPYPGMLNVGIILSNADWPFYPGLPSPVDLKIDHSELTVKEPATVISVKGRSSPCWLSFTLDVGVFQLEARYYEHSPEHVDVVIRVKSRPKIVASSTVQTLSV